MPPLDAGHGLSLALTCCALLLGLGGPQGFPADVPRALRFAARAQVELGDFGFAASDRGAPDLFVFGAASPGTSEPVTAMPESSLSGDTPGGNPGNNPGIRPSSDSGQLAMPGNREGGGDEDVAFRLLLTWARRLNAAHTPARGGFGFDAAKHLPASASECLHCALALRPGDTTALRASIDALGCEPGAEALRLGLLSDLGLRQRDDWRIGLELGLVNLQAFRPGPGLDEIRMAAHLAEAQGQAEHFLQALAQADANGHLRRALAR